MLRACFKKIGWNRLAAKALTLEAAEKQSFVKTNNLPPYCSWLSILAILAFMAILAIPAESHTIQPGQAGGGAVACSLYPAL